MKGIIKKIFIAILLLLLIAVAIAIGYRYLKTDDNVEKDETGTAIVYKEIGKIIEPYLDDDGYMEYDEDSIKESSEEVYKYAKKLKKNGDIEDCTYCEESNVVAFFYEDNDTVLYIPKIRGTYAGEADEFSVTSVETLSSLDKLVIDTVDNFSRFRITGAVESAKLITNSYEEYVSHNKIANKTWEDLDDVAEWMGELSKNNTRVILWRGHGTVFETPDGELLSVWCLPIERAESNDKYVDREYSLLESDGYCVISSNFWKNYCDDVDGGLFFTVSCNTGMDNGYAARIFFEKGFSTYAAPNGSIWTTYADKMMGRTVEYMCGKVDDNQYNFDEAVAKAKEDINETDVYGVTIVHANADPEKPFRLVPQTEEDIFNEYFKTLIKKYGLTNPVQTGTMYAAEDEWFDPEGILSACIYDLDGDDKKEGFVIRAVRDENDENTYVLEMEVYEIEGNKVVLSSALTMDEIYWWKNNHAHRDTHVSIVEKDEEIYIFCENYISVGYFADGEMQTYWALKYDGELEFSFSFLQNGAGSSEFSYTGYEYREGKVVYEELLCADESTGRVGTYDNFEKAIAEWFKRYGINAGDNFENGYRVFGKSILSNSNKIIPVTHYLSNCENPDYDNSIYRMQAVLTDYTAIRDIE